MRNIKKSKVIVSVLALVLAVAVSSCASSKQMGCPGAITSVEVDSDKNI